VQNFIGNILNHTVKTLEKKSEPKTPYDMKKAIYVEIKKLKAESYEQKIKKHKIRI
jgi:hypothetical protein